MNRLLQGDVGAGKTIVAMIAAVVAMENGFQVAFMAPTEILADQHFITIRRLLDSSRFRVASLTGSAHGGEAARGAGRARERRRFTSSSARTRWPRRPSRFTSSDSSIIDEQHRFGVLQRATLRAQGRESRRAGHDGDADSAHARAHGVRRSRRLDDSRAAAGPAADPHAGEAGIAPRRGVSAGAPRARARTPGLRDLSARRGVGEGRPARGDGDGRSPAGGGVSGVSRGAAARTTEVGGEGPRDGARSRAATCTCSSRRRSSRSASTCRMPP